MKRMICMSVLLLSLFGAMAQESDKEPLKIVKQSIQTVKKNAIRVDFSMNYTSATHETNQIEYGKSVIFGDNLYFNMSGIESFYDGTTQWVYMADVNEVTVTEPTMEERKEVNPVAIIESCLTDHRVTFDEEVGNEKRWFINIFPHDKKAEYFKVAIQISKKTHYPRLLTIYQKNGDKITFDWMTITILNNPNMSQFVFQEKNYPSVIVNDLR